jgi:hypothetical protein
VVEHALAIVSHAGDPASGLLRRQRATLGPIVEDIPRPVHHRQAEAPVLQTRTVTDPSGTSWRISLRWLPWKPKRRFRLDPDDIPGLDMAGDAVSSADDLLGGLGAVVLVVLASIALVALLPLLVLGLELLALLAVLAVGLLLAVAGLGRQVVEVERLSDDGDALVLERHCRGAWAARRALVELARAAEHGELPAQAAGAQRP